MKTKLALVLTLTSSLALSLGPAARAADDDAGPDLAVLRAENPVENPWWNEVGAECAQSALIARLEAREPGSVMARSELAEILAAERLWLIGELSPAGAIRVGRELRVRYLVVTTLVEYGTGARGLGKKRGRKLLGLGGPKYFRTELVLRLVETEAGRTVWSDSRRSETLLADLVASPGGDSTLVEEAVFKATVLPLLEEMATELHATATRLRRQDETAQELPAAATGG